MDRNIIQEFEGHIGNTTINNKMVYYSVDYLLDVIDEKFGEVYNDEFVEDLVNTIDNMYFKYEDFSFATLEHEFKYCIENAKNFNDIQFEYYGSDWKIGGLNERIKSGEFFIGKVEDRQM